MCGIGGYIGRPKKPKASYALMTNLFENLESRGIDAAGFWATEFSGNTTDSFDSKPKVIYDKCPGKPSDFIKTESWESLRKRKLNLIIVHARATSKGGGPASFNYNNHPFVSSDRRIGLVHNGTLEEASFLKEKYEVLSATDSEYLLRIYEAGLNREYYTIQDVPNEVAQRMNGIKDIWSYVSTGAMSVAIGERLDDHSRGLFLFRNEKRPLWLADMRQSLGQIFFFSSPDIWYRSLAGNEKLKKLCWGNEKLLELPPYQVWCLQTDKEDQIVTDENTFKMAVNVTCNGRKFNKGNYYSVKTHSTEPDFPVKISKFLDGFDKNVNSSKSDKPAPLSCPTVGRVLPRISNEIEEKGEVIIEARREYHNEQCDTIKQVAADIASTAHNLIMEGSMTESKYNDLLESLEQSKCDLKATLHILNG